MITVLAAGPFRNLSAADIGVLVRQLRELGPESEMRRARATAAILEEALQQAEAGESPVIHITDDERADVFAALDRAVLPGHAQLSDELIGLCQDCAD